MEKEEVQEEVRGAEGGWKAAGFQLELLSSST